MDSGFIGSIEAKAYLCHFFPRQEESDSQDIIFKNLLLNRNKTEAKEKSKRNRFYIFYFPYYKSYCV